MRETIKMPDIAMCTGEKNNMVCPLRESCYRHTAIANPLWQSYFTKPPFFEVSDKDGVFCDSYWKNDENS